MTFEAFNPARARSQTARRAAAAANAVRRARRDDLDRQIIALRNVGIQDDAIALELGLTAASVRQRVLRARARGLDVPRGARGFEARRRTPA